ncbi:MAG: RNA polymerase sigma factor [Defluviitaleaceae bacterium]|nr:RNA polymerase sigma factor [Defluviitaleaceae bacterium]
MEDSKIIDLFFARDEDAVAETQNKYAPYLFTVAKNILPNPQDAEECLSDTYFKAWETIPPLRPASLKGFLAKITRNRALDKYRAATAQKRANETGEIDILLSELTEAIPSPTDVHTSYENNLTADAINNFLRGMDADSIATIAKNTRASESKIKSSLARVRKKLQLALLEK